MVENEAIRAFNKPEIVEVHGVLRKKNGLIVHFSGTPGGNHFPYLFPEDLRRVIENQAIDGVCCSVVTPTDNFDANKGERNAFGTVGVILDLKTKDSLATASPSDDGSYPMSGRRQFNERDIAVLDLENSITKRTSHNEWGLRDYIVRGVFVIAPIEVWTERVHPVLGTIGGNVSLTVSDVAEALPGQSIFSFLNENIVRLIPAPTTVIAHSEIYLTA